MTYNINYANTNKSSFIFRFDYQNSAYQNPTDEGGIVSFQDSILVKNKVFKNLLYLEYKQKPIVTEILKKAWYAKN